MHPWTLRYNDAALEADLRASVFKMDYRYILQSVLFRLRVFRTSSIKIAKEICRARQAESTPAGMHLTPESGVSVTAHRD